MSNYNPPYHTPLYIRIQNLANEVKSCYSDDLEQKSMIVTKLEEASMWAERMHYENVTTITVQSDTISEV